MWRRASLLVLVTTLLASTVAAQGARPKRSRLPSAPVAPATDSRVRAGTLVRPDTVEIGDPFTLTVKVEVPVAAHVLWPTISDSTAPVAMRETAASRAGPTVTSSELGSVRTETAVYQLVAWNVGELPIALSDVVVQADGPATHIPISNVTVFARSVLPGDTSLHVPKPAKALFPRIVPWWETWWPAFIVLALLLLLVWLVKRKRQKRRQFLAFDPYARAVRDFQRLDKLELPDVGESGRFVALALEVMRMYLTARVPTSTLAQTSEELLASTHEDSRVPTERLTPLLMAGDAIKFGNLRIEPTRARDIASEARHIVSSVEQAEQARVKAESDAREKLEKQKKSERRAEEDEAKRQSRRNKSEAA